MGIRTALREALASRDTIAADEERDAAQQSGCTPISQLAARRRAQASGIVRSLTLCPRDDVPSLTAELYDGTASLDLVWLGRRRIAGVEPGRRLSVEGLVCGSTDRPTMYNPRYELRATDRA